MSKSKFKFPKRKTLLKHQVEALAYLSRRHPLGGGALFMEMRLGKTLAVVRHLQDETFFPSEKRHLIIAPTTVMPAWKKEFYEDGVGSVSLLNQSNKKKKLEEIGKGKRYVVVNPESIIPLDLANIDVEWDSITFDESYKLANPTSAISKYMLGGVAKRRVGTKVKPNGDSVPIYKVYVGFKNVPVKIALCGNPAPEDSLNYFGQMAFINRGVFLSKSNFYMYRLAYYAQGEDGFKWSPKKGTEDRVYHYVHHLAFVRTRAQCGMGSKKIYQTRTIPMTPKQRKSYQAMYDLWEADGVECELAMTRVLYLHRISGGMMLQKTEEAHLSPTWHNEGKFKEIINLLQTELLGEQILVWCKYTHEINNMCDTLAEARIKHGKIDGSVEKTEREIKRLKFHAGDYQVMVMQIETGKVGLDLSCADTAIYLSNAHSCDSRSQSEDRIIHPLKKKPVLIIDLITDGSIDGNIVELLNKKKTDARLFMSQLMKEVSNG